jgi:hypothetical protein
MPTARFTDPQTSHEAAQSVTNLTLVKRIILEVLQTAMTDEDLISTIRSRHGYTFASESGIRSRRAELVRAGYVEDSLGRSKTASGRQSILWVKA